jgi:hypothetical protein
MKRLAALLVLGGILVFTVNSVQAQSDWAFYRENPVKICTDCGAGDICYIADGYQGPRVFVPDSEIDDGTCVTTYYTLDCCKCHGPDVKHGGPKFPASQCP